MTKTKTSIDSPYKENLWCEIEREREREREGERDRERNRDKKHDTKSVLQKALPKVKSWNSRIRWANKKSLSGSY